MNISPKYFFKHNSLFIATAGVIAVAAFFFAAPIFTPRAHAAAIGSNVKLSGASKNSNSNNTVATDGTHVWILNSNGTVSEWGKYSLMATYPTASTKITTGLSILFDGTNLWVAGFSGASGGILTELSTNGTELQTISLPSSRPYGLAYDGTNIWVADNLRYVEEVSPTGSILFSTTTSMLPQLNNIVFDGTNMWVSGSGNKVFRFSTSGALVGSTTLTTSSTFDGSKGMAWDGTNMWVGGQNYITSDGLIDQISASGTLLQSVTGTIPTVMAFDGTNTWISGVDRTSLTSEILQATPSGVITKYSSSGGGGPTYVSSTKTLWSSDTTVTQTTNTESSDSSMSALSGNYLSITPSFPSVSTTSYTMSILENATSVTLTAATTDPLAGMFIESNATTTANNVPVTINFPSGAFGMDGNYEYIKVYAEDYSSTVYYLHVAATSTPDSALVFSSNNDAISCPASSPMHCTLDATSTETPIPYDFIPTLAVSGGSITVGSTPWTSGTDFTSTTNAGSFPSFTINVTGADNSTSTYSLVIDAENPFITGETDFTAPSSPFYVKTIGNNAWGVDGSGNLYEATPSGTVTEYPYGGAPGNQPNSGAFGLATNGTDLFIVGDAYPTSAIIEYTPGTNTWNTFIPPYTNNTDGYYGAATDKYGNLWAVNWDDNSLLEMSPTGTFIGNFPNSVVGNYTETYDAITYDGTNMWSYFGDRGAEQITEMSPTGTILTTVSMGSGCYPSELAFDGTNIWATDLCGTITEISPTGTILTSFSDTKTDLLTFDGSDIVTAGNGYAGFINPSTQKLSMYEMNLSANDVAYASSTDMIWVGGSNAFSTFSPNQPGLSVAPATYSITVTQGSNGTISPGSVTGISSGASQTFTITPDSGYAVATLTVDGSSVATSTSYTFSGITANHTITATFAAVPSSGSSNPGPVVSVASGGGGGGGHIPPGHISTGTSGTSTSTASSTSSNTSSTLPIISTSTTGTATSTASSTPAFTLPPVPPIPQLPTSTKKNNKADAYVFVVNDVLNGYGGTARPSSFTVSVKGKSASPSSFKGNTSGTLVAMQPGAYSVSERAVAGYTATLSPGCSGTAIAEQAAVCIIVTSQLPPPHLTVIANVINSYFGTATTSDLSVNVRGSKVSVPSFDGNAAGTLVTMQPGRYSVNAKAPAGYTLSYSGCSGSVTYGDAPVCTVTASDPPVAELLVTETVLNNFGGTKTADNFTVTVHGTRPTPSSFAGNAAGTAVVLKPGDYSVSEKAVAGYAITLSSGCSGSIVAGEIVHCTIVTSDLEPPYLTVYAGVVNGYGGTVLPSGLSLKVSGTKASPSTFPGNVAGTLVTLSSGKYSVTAGSLSGYTLNYTNCSGSVTYGSDPVCTVTATQTKPKGWVPPVVTPITPTSTPTSTVPTTPTSTTSGTPTSTISAPTSTLSTMPTSTTPTSTPSTPSSTSPTSTSIVAPTVPTSTQPLAPVSTGVTVNNGAPVVTTTTVTVTLPPAFTSGGGMVNIANNGGTSSGWIAVPSGPYPWTLTPGDGVKTVTVFYEAPNSSSTVTSTFQVFLDTGNEVLQEPELDCSGLYLTGYAFANQPSDPTTVIRIQQFLNKYMGDDLDVNGIYDAATQAAVNDFQVEYSKQILAPWVPYGLPNSTTPTSNTYKTTQRWINILACPGITIPTPVLP